MKKFIHPLPAYCLFLSILGTSAAFGNVKLPSIFGNHMVLQQEAKLPVWGTADPDEKVTVTVGDHSASTTAGTDGKWRVELPSFANGSPAVTMTVAGKNTIRFEDVLIGDVWLASGQSNMELPLASAANAKEAIANAKDPQLRLFLVSRKTSLEPLSDVSSSYLWQPWDGTLRKESEGDHPGTWIVCEPHAATNFSAVAYLFGKELRTHLNRPIGLIGSYWGGTMAESWTSLSGLQKAPPFQTYLEAYQQNVANFPKLNAEYEKANSTYQVELKEYEQKLQETIQQNQAATKAWQDESEKAKAAGQPQPPKPAPIRVQHPKVPALPDGGNLAPVNLYNAMISPLIPYAIKGVIWYQGESNTRTKSFEYRLLFPRLVADWREKWGQGNFPFLFVQISHFGYAGDQSSAIVREAQLRALSLPNTGMAVTVDIPCDDGAHPRDKADPAHRLALLARHICYGEDVVCSGPIYNEMKVEGDKIRISFSEIGSGLMIGKTPYQPSTFGNQPVIPLPSDKLVGFAIAGADQKFFDADARIDGDTVVVSNPNVSQPVAVRFAWGDTVQCNLYNKEGLPASPFRTDHWNNFKFRDLAPGAIPPTFEPSTFTLD